MSWSRHGFLPALLLFLLLLSASSQAQVRELAVRELPGSSHEVLPFDNSHHEFPVGRGSYYLGYVNEGEVEAYFWVSLDGQDLRAGNGCCTGIIRVDVPEDGLMKVEATGRGRLLLADAAVFDAEGPRIALEPRGGGPHAWAFSLNSAATRLCITAPEGMDALVLDEQFAILRQAQGQTDWTTEVDTRQRYAFLLVEPTESGPSVVFTVEPTCAGPTADDPGAPGLGLLSVLGALVVAGILRRW